jgi:hypothetical protein
MSQLRKGIKDTISTSLYGFYAAFRPFDGFWNIKHTRKNSGWASIVILASLCLTVVLKLQLTGFLFQHQDPKDNNIFLEILYVLIPLCVWVVINWSITTLFDGKATMKVIFIASVNALVPLIIVFIPQILLSHFFTLKENMFYIILESLAIIWSCWLFLAGLATVQDYTIFKTIVTTIATFIAIVAALFLAAVFYSSIQQLLSFIATLWSELLYWIV